MAEPVHDEASTVGPRCGNNPNVRLTDGDRQAIAEFREYLAARREGMPPTPDGKVDPEWTGPEGASDG
jgi:hypothetical protein